MDVIDNKIALLGLFVKPRTNGFIDGVKLFVLNIAAIVPRSQ